MWNVMFIAKYLIHIIFVYIRTCKQIFIHQKLNIFKCLRTQFWGKIDCGCVSIEKKPSVSSFWLLIFVKFNRDAQTFEKKEAKFQIYNHWIHLLSPHYQPLSILWLYVTVWARPDSCCFDCCNCQTEQYGFSHEKGSHL